MIEIVLEKLLQNLFFPDLKASRRSSFSILGAKITAAPRFFILVGGLYTVNIILCKNGLLSVGHNGLRGTTASHSLAWWLCDSVARAPHLEAFEILQRPPVYGGYQ